MKINRGELIGTLSKTFGHDGRMMLKYKPDIEVLKKQELIFIDIDRNLVPFFISELEIKNQKTAIVKFHDYNSRETMEEFVGCKIYIGKKEDSTSDNHIFPFKIKGFKVIDKVIGEIGIVEGIIEYPKNSLLQVNYEQKEILVPFSKEIIVKADSSKKIIEINAPDGILDVND